MNSKISNKTLHIIEISLFAVGINFYNLAGVWSPMENWYLEWANYIRSGLHPYTNFYLPFPPGAVFAYLPILQFPDPLLASHLFALAIFAAMSIGIYLLLTNYFSTTIALTISLFMSLLFEIDPTNNIAGYFELALCCISWGLFFYTKTKRSKINYYFAGILLAYGSLIKQNYVLNILCIVIFELLQFRKFCTMRKHFSYYLFAGIATIYISLSIYLLSFNGISAFIKDNLGQTKNPSFLIWIKNVFDFAAQVRDASWLSLTLFSLVLIFFVMTKFKHSSYRFVILLFSSMLGISSLILNQVTSPFANMRVILIILSTCFFISGYFTFIPNKKIVGFSTSSFVSVFAMSSLVMVCVAYGVSNHETTISLLHYVLPGNYLNLLGTQIWNRLLLITWITVPLYLFYQISTTAFKKFAKTKIDLLIHIEQTSFEKISITALILILAPADLLNAVNGGINSLSCFIITCIVLAILLSHFSHEKIKQQMTIILFIVPLSISAVNIIDFPYNWYYWHETKTVNTANDIQLFRNFRLTLSETQLYSRINQDLKVAKKEATINVTDVISLPAQPTLAWLLNGPTKVNYPVNCPIMWIDICSESAADKTSNELIRNPPGEIVYFDLDKEDAKSNSEAFRSKDLAAVFRLSNQLLADPRLKLIDSIPIGYGSKVLIFSRVRV